MMDPAVLRRAGAVQEEFRCGALLIEAGRAADNVYLIKSGQVRVFQITDAGREMTVALLGPGHICDVAPLAGHPTYQSFAVALTRAGVWRLPVQTFWEMVQEEPALRGLLARALGQRLALADARLFSLGLLPVGERLAPILRQVENCLGGVHPQLTREGVASLVGAQRETISRLASRLSVTSS